MRKRSRNIGEEIGKVTLQMIWEDIAPDKLKADEELRHKFEELLRNMDAYQSKDQKQKWRQEFRSALGDEVLKGLDAWEARMHKTEADREARIRENEEAEKARSEKFMEAQQQIQRGLQFANQLWPSAKRIMPVRASCSKRPTRPSSGIARMAAKYTGSSMPISRSARATRRPPLLMPSPLPPRPV